VDVLLFLFCFIFLLCFFVFVFFVYQRRDGPFFSIFSFGKDFFKYYKYFFVFFFSSSSKIHKQIRLGET